jgi:hypothetical protein
MTPPAISYSVMTVHFSVIHQQQLKLPEARSLAARDQGKQYSSSGKVARTVHHNTNLTGWVTLLQPTRRPTVLGHLSCLRAHWYGPSTQYKSYLTGTLFQLSRSDGCVGPALYGLRHLLYSLLRSSPALGQGSW